MSVSHKIENVCNPQNTIQHVSVSQKIENVSVSHKIVMYTIQSISEGGRQKSFDNGVRWSELVAIGLHVKKLSWNSVKNRRKQA